MLTLERLPVRTDCGGRNEFQISVLAQTATGATGATLPSWPWVAGGGGWWPAAHPQYWSVSQLAPPQQHAPGESS